MPTDKPKKILFLIQNLDVGGAERQLVSLAVGLQARNYQVSVAVFYSGGAYQQELERAAVEVLPLEKKGRWDIPGFLWRLFKSIRTMRPDILHPYMSVPNILSVLCKPFIPESKIVWGVRASNMHLSNYDWLIRFVFRLECWLSDYADIIIVNSYAGMEFAAMHGFPRGKMQVIPNGIDVQRFQPDFAAGKRLRREWQIDAEKLVIGLVGRLDPMKDHTTFLQAAALLNKRRQDVQFVCVGDGPDRYKQKLYVEAVKLGLQEVLLWAGSRADLPAVYNAFDIATTSSSFGEGFPNVIGEAMACGIPCVVTDVGDSARIVAEMGIVVPAKNPQRIADAWLQLINGKHSVAKHQIRARIVSNFSLDSLLRKSVELL